jgi:putative acetyltransferase
MPRERDFSAFGLGMTRSQNGWALKNLKTPSAHLQTERNAMIFRPEQLNEVKAIHAVECAAFGREAEADLVAQIRSGGGSTLSLVAVDGEEIVGHVLFSPVTIRSETSEFRALGMGPVAVRPDRQRQRVGSALIQASLDFLRQQGHAVVVVEGDPAYYARFGFEDASRFGLACEFNPPLGCFMVLELRAGTLAGRTGMVYYLPELQNAG